MRILGGLLFNLLLAVQAITGFLRNHQHVARVVSGCFIIMLLLPAGRCMNQIEATLTRVDELIVANGKVFTEACVAGQTAHDKIVAAQQAGLPHPWSQTDINKELATYQAGVALCGPEPYAPPQNLAELLSMIPKIQAWVKALTDWTKLT